MEMQKTARLAQRVAGSITAKVLHSLNLSRKNVIFRNSHQSIVHTILKTPILQGLQAHDLRYTITKFYYLTKGPTSK